MPVENLIQQSPVYACLFRPRDLAASCVDFTLWKSDEVVQFEDPQASPSLRPHKRRLTDD
jgi:hypothetical protein